MTVIRKRSRTFYSIGEVCRMLDLKPHVLRYWETRFEALSPSKNRAGNRVYVAADLQMIALIDHLVHEERYSIDGARRRISELEQEGSASGESSRALEAAFLKSLRLELNEILSLLDPKPR